MSFTCFDFTVTADNDGCTLRTFLRKACGISARSMTLLKFSEGIYRRDTVIKAHEIVHSGEVITLRLPREKNDIAPVRGELSILYEDEYLLIVDKPAAMPVHPTKKHQLDTLANIVSCYQQGRGESYTFRALNRLDKDTSGCVMIAKDRLTYALVKDSIKKKYIAVCEGVIFDEGVIDSPIGMEENSKIKRCVRADGQSAITHYRPISNDGQHTLLELWLETGRTHQIRCHMSSIGHPLAGDDLYGGSLIEITRQALHCREITFEHPYTKKQIRISTDIPYEIAQIIKEGR